MEVTIGWGEPLGARVWAMALESETLSHRLLSDGKAAKVGATMSVFLSVCFDASCLDSESDLA